MWDVLITTPIMAAFTVLDFFVHSRSGFYAVMGVEAFLLYFIDYACNSITASLMYDYATTGEASMETAIPRVKKALPGVITFAAVSALLDVASTYARERNDVASRIILRVLRAIWTTATYVIMPALVIEGVSFGDAFKRSKALMDHDPTGVGAGIVAMSITSYIVAAVCFPLAYVLMRAGAHIHSADRRAAVDAGRQPLLGGQRLDEDRLLDLLLHVGARMRAHRHAPITRSRRCRCAPRSTPPSSEGIRLAACGSRRVVDGISSDVARYAVLTHAAHSRRSVARGTSRTRARRWHRPFGASAPRRRRNAVNDPPLSIGFGAVSVGS